MGKSSVLENKQARTVRRMEVSCTATEVQEKLGEFIDSECDYFDLQSPNLRLGLRIQRNLGHFNAIEIREMTILDTGGNGKRLFNQVRDFLEAHPLICLVIFNQPSEDIAHELAHHGYDGEKDSPRLYK